MIFSISNFLDSRKHKFIQFPYTSSVIVCDLTRAENQVFSFHSETYKI